ncbi:MAG: hypothetical protein ACKPKO_29135, partial [Candidatus Fonsibacter sp.]
MMEINGDNPDLFTLVSNMHYHNTINSISQKDVLNWGNMRADITNDEFTIKSNIPMNYPITPLGSS